MIAILPRGYDLKQSVMPFEILDDIYFSNLNSNVDIKKI